MLYNWFALNKALACDQAAWRNINPKKYRPVEAGWRFRLSESAHRATGCAQKRRWRMGVQADDTAKPRTSSSDEHRR